MTEPAAGGAQGAQGSGAAAGAGDGQAAPWYSGVQDAGLKTWIESKGFKDPEAVATSALNLEKLVGADRIGRTVVLPKDDKDLEGIKAFRAKLGVPDSPDAYALPVPEGGDAAFAKTAAGWFMEAGVPPGAARTIAQQWNGHMQAAMQAMEAEESAKSEQALGEIKGKWGDKFDQNAEVARRYVKASGLNEEQLSAVERALGTATFLETFHKLGTSLGEAGFTTGDNAGGAGFTPAKAAAHKEMTDLRQLRIEGKISQEEFLRKNEELNARIAA